MSSDMTTKLTDAIVLHQATRAIDRIYAAVEAVTSDDPRVTIEVYIDPERIAARFEPDGDNSFTVLVLIDVVIGDLVDLRIDPALSSANMRRLMTDAIAEYRKSYAIDSGASF